MKTKHTPGPWKSEEESDRHIILSKHPQQYSPGVFKEYYEICSLKKGSFAQNEANAALIAAAPDMLEALESIKNHSLNYNYKKDSSHNDARMMAILSLAGIAIAKALGS